jgi:uncharacterized repeat protein (TIGR03803 family)
VIQADNGNLYGTASYGGVNGYGTAFEITATNQLSVLHSFDLTDGFSISSPPIQASDGNLYGTTWAGGAPGYGGTIYEITSAGAFNTLYNFCTTSSNSSCTGEYPGYTLAQATDGTFIGATTYAGAYNYGTVFSFSNGLSPLVETVPIAAKPGARVIILGNNLTGSTRITFNGTPATFTVESDTYITATVPAGATTGTVQVTTPTGTLNSNPVFQVLQ